MDDGGSTRAAGCKGVHVGHDVMPTFLFLLGGQLEVDVSEVGLHLAKLVLCDGEAQLLNGRRVERNGEGRRRGGGGGGGGEGMSFQCK